MNKTARVRFCRETLPFPSAPTPDLAPFIPLPPFSLLSPPPAVLPSSLLAARASRIAISSAARASSLPPHGMGKLRRSTAYHCGLWHAAVCRADFARWIHLRQSLPNLPSRRRQSEPLTSAERPLPGSYQRSRYGRAPYGALREICGGHCGGEVRASAAGLQVALRILAIPAAIH